VNRNREVHTLAGAYAMDAIFPADRARFERHLAGCPECAREIASLREAIARLATATAVPPPPGLKERVLAAAAATRQRPPAAPPRQVPRRRLVLAGAAVAALAAAAAAVVFTAADLHALPASRGYELWLIGPAGQRPVAMLPPARHDMTGPVIASGLRPGDHLALTAEPASGSARPGAPMMLDVALT
jgi:anti-sigma factor RsiW